MRLNVLAVGVGAGVAWGLCVLFLGLIAIGGWGVEMVEMLAGAYIGFSATVPGALIGGLWAFVDAGVFAAIGAAVYNAIAGKGGGAGAP